MHVTKNVNKDWSDAESVYETLLVVNKILNVCKKEDDNFNAVDKHDKRMEIEENWAHGVRTTGKHKKNNTKVELLVKIKTSEQLCRLKQKVRNTCEEEGVWTKQKKSRLEYVKRNGMLIGAYVHYSSL